MQGQRLLGIWNKKQRRFGSVQSRIRWRRNFCNLQRGKFPVRTIACPQQPSPFEVGGNGSQREDVGAPFEMLRVLRWPILSGIIESFDLRSISNLSTSIEFLPFSTWIWLSNVGTLLCIYIYIYNAWRKWNGIEAKSSYLSRDVASPIRIGLISIVDWFRGNRRNDCVRYHQKGWCQRDSKIIENFSLNLFEVIC